MLLEDKVIMIAGIGPGLGLKLARAAAREGAKVAIGARNEAFLEEVRSEIAATGADIIACRTDVTDEAQCQAFADATAKAYGRIDGLVNSGFRHGEFMPYEQQDLADWRATMEVNLFGPLNMVNAVLPAMKAQGGGAICNISTQATVSPFTGEAGYSTSKGALNVATKVLAKELGQYKIRVNAAVMGWMWGKSVKDYMAGAAEAQGIDQQVLIDAVTQNIPLGEIPPDEDCANAALFLVSDYARVVTGAALMINGGEILA